MALHALYKIAHSQKERHLRPSHVEQLHCYHDWAEYFEPYVNNKIKHYQVPHRTRFTRVMGKAVMHYQLFSPEAGNTIILLQYNFSSMVCLLKR